MAIPLAPFYTQADQDIYTGGDHFIPQEQYRLGNFNTVAPVPPETTDTGIINTQAAGSYMGYPSYAAWLAAQGGGGGGGGLSDYGLDMSNMKTTFQNVWNGSSWVRTPVTGYYDPASQTYKTAKGKNIEHAGLFTGKPKEGDIEATPFEFPSMFTILKKMKEKITGPKIDENIVREKITTDVKDAPTTDGDWQGKTFTGPAFKTEGGRDVKQDWSDATDFSQSSDAELWAQGGRVGLQDGGGPAGGSSAGGDYGGSVNPEQEYAGRTFQDTYGGDKNTLVDDTNYKKIITDKVEEKLMEKTPPTIDRRKQIWANVEKYRNLDEPRYDWMDGSDAPDTKTKDLFTNTFSNLQLQYPDIKMTDEFGYIDHAKTKQVIDQAVLDGTFSPVEGLEFSQNIGTEGNPSSMGVNYSNDFLNFNTSDIDSGTYTVGGKYNYEPTSTFLGDVNLASKFNVRDDDLYSKNIGFDYGDGTLTGSSTTFPGHDFQRNKLGLNKKFNINDNIGLQLKGDVSNVRRDDKTLYTDQSLTPGLSFNYGLGDGSIQANINKEIMEGGSKPNIGASFNIPYKGLDFTGQASNLLSDPQGTFGVAKRIGNENSGNFLDFSTQIDPFKGDKTAMFKVGTTFKHGGLAGIL